MTDEIKSAMDSDFAALRAQKATWQTDGKGIRGDVVTVTNTKAELVWEQSRPRNQPVIDLPG
jgi:hypothetical protein